MVNEYNDANIYKIEIKNGQIDKKKVVLVVLCLVVVIELIFTIKHSLRVIAGHKIYKQYETQLASIKLQEEQKQAKMAEEKEKKRQERLPKLTEERKRKYQKYIQFR